MERYVIINTATNKIMARYTRQSYAQVMAEELSKQITIDGSPMPITIGWEEWERNEDYEVVLLRKDYSDEVKTGKYYTSPKPPAYINNKHWKDIVLAGKE